jgi:hypothetical protein
MLEGVGCTHGDIGHDKGGDGGDGARQHHGQVLRNPLWSFCTTLLQGAEIRDAERRANATITGKASVNENRWRFQLKIKFSFS